MSIAAAEPELSANGTAASQYRDGYRPARIELRPSDRSSRPVEPIFGPIPTNPGSTIAPAEISELVNIRKR
ncbi:MAG: hypothetical protein OXL36_21345 [Bryobacterales bacterium]|nr:hypothetical protein [Bryobacterales bacterium]MDE0293183.1 hypothetical protein [Bryobacterales bacterium]